MWNWDWCSLPGTLSSSPRWRQDSDEPYVDRVFESQSPDHVAGLAGFRFVNEKLDAGVFGDGVALARCALRKCRGSQLR
jgi:hypothetical protein